MRWISFIFYIYIQVIFTYHSANCQFQNNFNSLRPSWAVVFFIFLLHLSLSSCPQLVPLSLLVLMYTSSSHPSLIILFRSVFLTFFLHISCHFSDFICITFCCNRSTAPFIPFNFNYLPLKWLCTMLLIFQWNVTLFFFIPLLLPLCPWISWFRWPLTIDNNFILSVFVSGVTLFNFIKWHLNLTHSSYSTCLDSDKMTWYRIFLLSIARSLLFSLCLFIFSCLAYHSSVIVPRYSIDTLDKCLFSLIDNLSITFPESMYKLYPSYAN